MTPPVSAEKKRASQACGKCDECLNGIQCRDFPAWEARCDNPSCYGVIISLRDSTGEYNVEKCDDCGRFEYDEDAMEWLASNFHKMRLPKETT
jgi:hypothetical protein